MKKLAIVLLGVLMAGSAYAEETVRIADVLRAARSKNFEQNVAEFNRLHGISEDNGESVDTFAVNYLQETKRKFQEDFKRTYGTLISARATEEIFRKVYPYAYMQKVMHMNSIDQARDAIDSRYNLLF